MTRTAADAVLETLLAWDVRRVFICPGSTEAPFLDASLRHPSVEVVLTTHESVAVAMADGHARATGSPAVAYLHTHLGLANGLAHLDAARLARSPVVVLTGLKPAVLRGRGGFTALAATEELVRPLVKRSWEARRPELIPEDLTRALRVAAAEPTGPVWLGLGQDLMAAACSAPVPDPARFRVTARVAPDPDQLRSLAELLRRARRPVLVAGAEVGRHGAEALVVRLAERLEARVCNEDRRGFERPGFPSDHRLFAGNYAVDNPAAAAADLLVFLGCRCFTEFEPSAAPLVPDGSRVAHTHVDPTELGRVQGVDLALVGDESLIATGLLDLLGEVPSPAGERDHAGAARGSRLGGPGRPTSGAATVAEVAEALAEVVDERTTVFEDATTSELALLRALPQRSSHALFTSVSGSLGWGMGAALGYRLAAPERRVLAVLGDGVFQFGVPALWGAAYYRIPVVFVVINNRSYAAVGAALRRYGGDAVASGRYPGKDISGVDIAAVATGFGVPARRLSRADELPAVIKEFQHLDGPALVEVLTDPDDLGP